MGIKMKDVYEIAGISRQYHHSVLKKRHGETEMWHRLMEMVSEYRKERPRSSARKIHQALRIDTVGINRFERYVSSRGLSVRPRRSFIKTTHPGPTRYSNLVNGLEITNINQLWVSDITYFLAENLTLYIVMILDVYSRRIIGYSCSDNMLAVNNKKALRMAFKLRGCKKFEKLIHHSDKGSQYGANEYTKMLLGADVKISMANNCLENPYAERVNGIIKNDYLIAYEINTLGKLEKAMHRSVMLYNNYPHGKLAQGKSPVEFEKSLLEKNGQPSKVMKLYDFNKNLNEQQT